MIACAFCKGEMPDAATVCPLCGAFERPTGEGDRWYPWWDAEPLRTMATAARLFIVLAIIYVGLSALAVIAYLTRGD